MLQNIHNLSVYLDIRNMECRFLFKTYLFKVQNFHPLINMELNVKISLQETKTCSTFMELSTI
jgi:hypothetical protein